MNKKAAVASVLALAVTVGSGALFASGSVSAAERFQKAGGHFGTVIEMRGTLDNAGLTQLLGMTQKELKTALRSGMSLAAIAEDKGVDVRMVIERVAEAMTAKLDQQLKDGRLTQAEYDSLQTKVSTRAAGLVNRAFSGKDRGGFDRRAVFGDETLAKLLGLTAAELRTELQSGKTLAAIAGERGVPVQEVTDRVKKTLTAVLDGRLADGKLTQAQVDERKTGLAARAEEIVNSVPRGKGDRRRGGESRDWVGLRG